MELFIKIVRWTLSFLLAIIFGLLLMLSIIISSIAITVTNRETPKQWLVESGIYESAKPLIRNVILNRSEPGGEMEEFALRLDDPNDPFGSLVNDKLSGPFLQNSSETVIDAFYDWFEGETDVPNFTINVANSKDEVVDMAIILFEEKVNSLPQCEPGVQMEDMANPLSAECLPEGYDVDLVGEFIKENSETPEFLKFAENFNVSSSMIKLPPGVGAEVQLGYALLNSAPYLLLFLLTLIAVILAAMIPGAIRGVRMVGTSIILYSLILFALSFFAMNYMDEVFSFAYQLAEIPQEDLVVKAVENIFFVMLDSFFDSMKIVAGAALVYGIIFTVTGYFIARWVENRGKEKIGTNDLSTTK